MTEDNPEPSGSASTTTDKIENYIPSAATLQKFNADFPILAASNDLPKLTASIQNNTATSLAEIGNLMNSYIKLYDSHTAYDAKYVDSQEEIDKLQEQVNTLQSQLSSAANVEKERLYCILENGGSGHKRLSPEHPNPDTFHGKDDRPKLSYFIKEMRDKLAVNGGLVPY